MTRSQVFSSTQDGSKLFTQQNYEELRARSQLLTLKGVEGRAKLRDGTKKCRNPSLRLATKTKGLQGCGPKGSPRIKARGSLGVTSHTPGSVRKCEGV